MHARHAAPIRPRSWTWSHSARASTAAEAASATGIARATAGAALARLVGKGILEYVELPAGERGYGLVEATSAPTGRVSNKPEETD